MITRVRSRFVSFALAAAVAMALTAKGQTPLMQYFTYQGRLTENGAPVTTPTIVSFSLYDAAGLGSLLGTQTITVDPDDNGLFTVDLNTQDQFGVNPFDGNQRWLEIRIGANPPLVPRQELTAVPYANFARMAATTMDRNSLDAADGNPLDALYLNEVGNVGIGTFQPDNTLHVHKGSAGAVTANPLSALVVENSADAFISVLTPNANERGILFGSPGNNAAGGIIYNNNNGGGMQFRTNGNVTRLFLGGNGDLELDWPNANNGTLLGGGLRFGLGSGEGIASKRTAGGNQFGLDFYTGWNARMSIASGGNVGIGTTSPTSGKLHVSASNNNGVYATTTSGTLNAYSAVYGENTTTATILGGFGVRGVGQTGVAGIVIAGVQAGSGTGVLGDAGSMGAYGVQGLNSRTAGGYGVFGKYGTSSSGVTDYPVAGVFGDGGVTPAAPGVVGTSRTGEGVVAVSREFDGLYAESRASGHSAIHCKNTAATADTYGIFAETSTFDGATGWFVNHAGGTALGVEGRAMFNYPPSTATADINTNTGGLTVWNGENRSLALYTGGLYHDIKSKGAPLVLNYGADASQNIYMCAGGSSGRVGINTTNPVATLDVNGTTRTGVLEIFGGSDLAEPFESGDCLEPGMVVSIDSQRPGQLRPSDEPYDSKVAGIISGANALSPGMVMKSAGQEHADGTYPLALTGRVWCWCDASSGAIQPGDLLTTSSAPGHAMRVNDERRDVPRGCVIGKAMTPLAQGERGLVLVLVNLQ